MDFASNFIGGKSLVTMALLGVLLYIFFSVSPGLSILLLLGTAFAFYM